MAEAERVRVAAGEEVRLAADGDLAERALGAVVVEHEAAVVEEAHQRALLPDRVVQRGAQEPALRRAHELLVAHFAEEAGKSSSSAAGIRNRPRSSRL